MTPQQQQERISMTNKNIINYFLKYDKVPAVNYGNLNSKLVFKKENQASEVIKFEYSITGVKDTFVMELPLIYDLRDFDILGWLDRYEELTNNKKWTDIEISLILKNLIKDGNFHPPQSVITYIEYRKTILDYAYPKEGSLLLMTQINNMKQSNYTFISEYYQVLQQLISKYAVMNNLNKAESDRRLYEHFYLGLQDDTQRFLLKELLMNPQDYPSRLLDLEKKLLQKIEPTALPDNGTNVMESPQVKTISTTPKLWCSFHKSRTHSNAQCRMIKQKKESNNKAQSITKEESSGRKINDSAYFISQNNSILEIPVIINQKSCVGIIDTGSSVTYVNKKLLNKRQLSTIHDVKNIAYTANGDTLVSEGIINLHLLLQSCELELNNINIISNVKFDIILGNDFLLTYSLIIDYNQRCIYNQNFKVNFLNRTEAGLQEAKNEKIMTTSVDYYQQQKKLLLEKYLKQNASFTVIKTEPVKIKLRSEINEFQAKPYVVPLKYTDFSKVEIQRLIDKDIIEETKSYISSPAFFRKQKNKTRS